MKQLNMKNRIECLPKSSQFYFDMSTLVDGRVTLFQGDSSDSVANVKKHDSTKKMVLNFIESSLMSNNVNKIYAVYKSEVIGELFRYL